MLPTTTSPPTTASFLTNSSPGLERCWYAVATADEITEQPRSVQLLGRHWCVLRLDGALTAFEDRCPHRLAPLSIGTNCGAVLECRYHGWRFERTGACTLIPSLGPDAAIPPRASVAIPYGVVERYGLVWLAPAAPVCELPAFDEWDDPAYDTCRNEPREVACSAFQLTDNFLDATHLPTVHTQTFGVADAGYLPPHEVRADGWRISTLYRVTYRNHDDPLVATGEHPLAQPQDLYKEACPASTALIRLDMPLTGKRLAILFALQPQHDGSSRVYKQMARNDFAGDEQRIKESLAFEDLVMDEDLVVLEAYRELGLPLDVRNEVHTRTDKLSLAYRRLLAALVGGEEAFTLTPRS